MASTDSFFAVDYFYRLELFQKFSPWWFRLHDFGYSFEFLSE